MAKHKVCCISRGHQTPTFSQWEELTHLLPCLTQWRQLPLLPQEFYEVHMTVVVKSIDGQLKVRESIEDESDQQPCVCVYRCFWLANKYIICKIAWLLNVVADWLAGYLPTYLSQLQPAERTRVQFVIQLQARWLVFFSHVLYNCGWVTC